MAKPDAFTLAGPIPRLLYKRLQAALKPLGPFREEVKKTSIHLARGSAFAGVPLRKQHLLLAIKAAQAIKSPRVSTLLRWLREAYDLG